MTTGDSHAYTYIYRQYCPDLFRYGMKLTSNKQMVEDIMHDLLVKIWEYREEIHINSSIKFYLLTAFRREIMQSLRSSKKMVNLEDYDKNIFWEPSFMELLVEKQIRLESSKKLRDLMNSLSDRQKEAMYLYYVEGFTYAEIGELMQIQRQSIYNLIFRSVQFIKKAVEDSKV